MKYILLVALIAISLTSFSQLDTTFLRNDIERTYDEMSGKINIESPEINGIKFIKVIKKNSIRYYLSLDTKGQIVSLYKRDIIILFTDGSKMNKNDEISCEVSSGGGAYDYSAFLSLSENDLLILKKKAIKKFRLYIYDNEPLEADQPETLKWYITEICKLK